MNKFLITNFLFIFLMFFVDNSFADKYREHFHEAVSLARSGHVEKGEKLLTNLISKNQRVAELYIWRGRYRKSFGNNCLSAVADFNIAEKLSSIPRVEIYWFRGDCYYNLRIYNQSISDYSRAIRLNPRRGKMYYYRAKAYGKLGMIDMVNKDLKSLLKYNPGYKEKANELYQKTLQGNRDF